MKGRRVKTKRKISKLEEEEKGAEKRKKRRVGCWNRGKRKKKGA